MLSTHETKNDEMVIRIVRFPRRRLGRRRVERLPARKWSRGDARKFLRPHTVAVSMRERKMPKYDILQ